MILTVDIGNSRVKWASWRCGEIVGRGVADYHKKEAANVFDEVFATVTLPSCVLALCVAGDTMRQALSSWVQQHWQLDVEFLQTEKQYKNIKNAYAEPSQHGVDRWAAVVAAVQSNPDTSLCVISAGTAITFDLIAQSGQHLGGYIMPSFTTMHKCLLADTANLKSTPLEMSVNPYVLQHNVPSNTKDAINQGLHLLLQAGIRELCQLAGQKLGGSMRILITGGFAETILCYPDLPAMRYYPDLVMQGLYSMMTQK